MAKIKSKKAIDLKDNKKTNYLKIIFLSLIVLLMGCIFISQKKDLFIDELFTYGLANNSFQLKIDDYKQYTGEEVLLNYASVKPNERFNIGNIYFNQTMDTHPPLYYMLVNFISSLNPGKFSIWYGLIINVLLAIVLFWEIKYLIDKITHNETISILITLSAFMNYGFINEIVFTRMYVMLSCVSMAFAILIINKIENGSEENDKLDIKYLLSFFTICLLGILTQYHFMILAGIFSLVLAVHCIKNKRIKLLITSAIAGILSILASYLIFPAILDHMFGSSTSIHSLTRDIGSSTASERGVQFLLSIYQSFFGVAFIPYLIILIILVILLIKYYKKNAIALPKVISENKILFISIFTSIAYYLLVTVSTNFVFSRYMYNIYPFILISIIAPIFLILKRIKPGTAFLSIIIMFALSLTSILTSAPSFLYPNNAPVDRYLYANKDTKTILIYYENFRTDEESRSVNNTWKLPVNLYLFRNMDNMIYANAADSDFENKISNIIAEDDDLFVVLFTNMDDDKIINQLMSNSNTSSYQKILMTGYMHMYRLENDN